MIRIGKPVKLLEWGEGTSTTNQVWRDIAKGQLRVSPKVKMGVTVLEVVLDGPMSKQNQKDDHIKVVQQGEGMTPIGDKWGEVAVGRLKSVENEGGKTVVYIELKGAVKIGKGM
ncbi:MAG TPA: hypothetical protein V6C81_17545 [Planktothrix sp.]